MSAIPLRYVRLERFRAVLRPFHTAAILQSPPVLAFESSVIFQRLRSKSKEGLPLDGLGDSRRNYEVKRFIRSNSIARVHRSSARICSCAYWIQADESCTTTTRPQHGHNTKH